jgi:hypothetical protein
MGQRHRPAPILQREVALKKVKGDKPGPKIPELSLHFRREHSRSDANHHKKTAPEPYGGIHEPDEPDYPGHAGTLGKFHHTAK